MPEATVEDVRARALEYMMRSKTSAHKLAMDIGSSDSTVQQWLQGQNSSVKLAALINTWLAKRNAGPSLVSTAFSPPLLFTLAGWLGAPRHAVSVVYLSEMAEVLFTGSRRGHIWIWSLSTKEMTPALLRPRLLLLGHKTNVSALVECRHDADLYNHPYRHMLVSASEDGEVILWNVADGRCISTNPHAFDGIPTDLRMTNNGKHIVCSGHSVEIVVLDALTLEVVYTLRHHTNWVSCTALQPQEGSSPSDYLLSVTFDGLLLAWQLDQMCLRPNVLPQRTISQDVTEAQRMVLSPFQSGLMLVVCKRECQLYTTGKFEKLLVIRCPSALGWSGGVFVAIDVVMLWGRHGRAYLYQIPTYPVATSLTRENRSMARSGPIAAKPTPSAAPIVVDPSAPKEAVLLSVLQRSSYEDYHSPTYAYIPLKRDLPDYKQLHTVIAFGSIKQKTSITVWRFPVTRSDWAPVMEPSIDLSMDDLWSQEDESQWHPGEKVATAVSFVRNRWFIQGYEDGHIRVSQIENFSSKTRVSRVLHGHTKRVTCLIGPPMTKPYLLSGSADCTVKVWNIETCELLFTFMSHTCEISALIVPPPEAGPKMRHCVCSVGSDNSLAVLSLDDMKCQYLFGGHPYSITSLHWHLRDDYIIIACADGTVYVWQMGTGHLDRRASGQVAADVLRSCDVRINITSEFDYQNFDERQLVQCFPVVSDNRASDPHIQILMMNVRPILNTLAELNPPSDLASPLLGASLSSPMQSRPGSPEPSPSLSSLADMNIDPSMSFSEGFTVQEPSMHAAAPSTPMRSSASTSSLASPSPRRVVTGPSLMVPTSSPLIPGPLSPSPSNSAPTTSPALALVQVMVSALMVWGVDENIDRMCEERLGLQRLPSNVTLATRGVGGHLSIFAPGALSSGASEWNVSPHFSASRLLAIVAFTKGLLSRRGCEAEVSAIMTFYCAHLYERLPKDTCKPSIGYLARYWQDAHPYVQDAARALFSSTISQLKPEELQDMVKFWIHFLPYGNGMNRSNPLSALVLGIASTHLPSILNDRGRNQVAQSLLMLMSEGAWPVDRLVAVEIVGRGFRAWSQHANESTLLRALFQISFVAVPSSTMLHHQATRGPVSASGALGSDAANFVARVKVASASGSTLPAPMAVPAQRAGSGSSIMRSVTPSGQSGARSQASSGSIATSAMHPVYPSPTTAGLPPLPGGAAAGKGHRRAESASLPPRSATASPPPRMSDADNGPMMVLPGSSPTKASAGVMGQQGDGENQQGQQQRAAVASPLAIALMREARQALILAADATPQGVLALIDEKIGTKGTPMDRVGALKLIALLTKKRSVLYCDAVNRFVELSLRPLVEDKHGPLREAVVRAFSDVLQQLVRSYPFVSFNTGTQRLAVGGQDGIVSLYDVRSGTRLSTYSVEGYKAPICAVALSKDGRFLITASVVDAMCAVFNVGQQASIPSFFSSRNTTLKHVQRISGDIPIRSASALLDGTVRFEWPDAPGRVLLHIGRPEPLVIAINDDGKR